MHLLAIAIYAAAMTAANLSVAAFGPSVTPINAFVFIGLDLTLRDFLQYRLTRAQMGTLIISTSIITYVLAPGAERIAVASAAAFLLAAFADWAVFNRLADRPWMLRTTGSNVAGAAVDSITFPTLAFGAYLPTVIVLQFLAKVGGGAVWAYLLRNRLGKRA